MIERTSVVDRLRRGEVAGDDVRAARDVVGMTQAELAAVLGVAKETVSRWETGERAAPRTAQLAILAVLEGVV